MESELLRSCGNNLVTEDVKIHFPLTGDTGRHDSPYSRMLQSTCHDGLSVSRGGGNSISTYSVTHVSPDHHDICSPSLVFIGNLLHDLKLLIRFSPDGINLHIKRKVQIEKGPL
jgi:hypothetical protein